MAILKLKPHLSQEELQEKLKSEKDIRFYKLWQILNAVANTPGIKAEYIAVVLSSSATIVRRTVQIYNKHGADFPNLKLWGGRREPLCHLSIIEEKELLKSIEKKSRQGEILTAKDIKRVVEKKVENGVSDDYIWDLFKRHKWTKKAPRPRHPKQNIQAQEEFKKNFQKFWQPTS